MLKLLSSLFRYYYLYILSYFDYNLGSSFIINNELSKDSSHIKEVNVVNDKSFSNKKSENIKKTTSFLPQFYLLLHFLFYIGLGYLSIQDSYSAEDKAPVTNVDQLDVSNTNNRSLATSPSCLLDTVGLGAIIGGLAGGVVEIITGIVEIQSGIALLALPDPTLISKIKGTALKVTGWASVTAGIAGLSYIALAGLGFGQCMHSFVKDPVEYYPDVIPTDHPDFDNRGKMKMVVKDSGGRFNGFKKVEGTNYSGYGVNIKCNNENDCYFLGRPAAASDNITVCARGIFPIAVVPFAGTFEGCYSGTSFYTGGFTYNVISKYPYYNGPNSMLCPEEYRAVARMPNLESEDSNGYMKLKCTEEDPNKCSSGTMSPLFRDSGDPERFKLFYSRPECKTGRAGETLTLQGHKYKIIEKGGTHLCARLTGLVGGIPWIQSYEIGCIKKLNTNLNPKCAASVPVYEDLVFDKDTGLITSNGGSNPKARIIRYDDSPCYNKCSVSQLCTTYVKGLFQAPIPITSYLMGCIKDSVGNVVYGCNSLSLSTSNDDSAAKNSGMLYAMQKRMRLIIIILMTLSVVLFGMQMLFFDSAPKPPEIMVFLLKIAVVLYLTVDHGRENGMTKYAQYVEKISTELQSIVLNSKNKKTITGDKICDYSDIDYVKNFPGANGTIVKKDFGYLKVWDILDCHFIYYLSHGLVNPLVSGYHATVFDENIFHIVVSALNLGLRWIFLIIGMILFAIFLLFVIIQVVELMILATMGFYILIMLSPIFVPFLLFKSTKQIFDSWIGQLITYSLYPVMLFAFMGFMFLVVDNLAFGQTRFVKAKAYVNGNETRVFQVDTSNDFQLKCSSNGFTTPTNKNNPNEGDITPGCDCDSVLCMMSSYVIKTKSSDSVLGSSPGGAIKATTEGAHKFQIGVLGMMFTMLIFYHFAKIMPQIVQALSGSTKALMGAGRKVRGASSRMEGLGGIAAGLLKGNKKSDDKGDDKKAARTSVSTK
jgi:type IV secretory pathway VirB6-like protein